LIAENNHLDSEATANQYTMAPFKATELRLHEEKSLFTQQLKDFRPGD
jgi:hypothetical protein